jgi:uncharacterized membrane protein YtjA (UPF0391 family)
MISADRGLNGSQSGAFIARAAIPGFGGIARAAVGIAKIVFSLRLSCL